MRAVLITFIVLLHQATFCQDINFVFFTTKVPIQIVDQYVGYNVGNLILKTGVSTFTLHSSTVYNIDYTYDLCQYTDFKEYLKKHYFRDSSINVFVMGGRLLNELGRTITEGDRMIFLNFRGFLTLDTFVHEIGHFYGLRHVESLGNMMSPELIIYNFSREQLDTIKSNIH